jgi:hypothetical protein
MTKTETAVMELIIEGKNQRIKRLEEALRSIADLQMYEIADETAAAMLASIRETATTALRKTK